MTQRTRRELLKFAGATAGIPLLTSLLPSRAEAQTTAPRRLVVFSIPNGKPEQFFYPDIADTQLPQLAPGVHGVPLATLPGNISLIMGSSWAKTDVTLVRGLDLTTPIADHGRAPLLSGVKEAYNTFGFPAFGASIDMLLENSPAFYPARPYTGAIRYAPRFGYMGYSFMNLNGQLNEPGYIDSDVGLYSQLFGDLNGGTPRVDPVQRKSSVLNSWQQRVDLLRANPRLGSEDRKRLDQQRDIVVAVRNNLARTGGACTAPSVGLSQGATRRMYEAANEMVVAAFACDRTRLAMMHIQDCDDLLLDYTAFHGASHSSNVDTELHMQFGLYNKWAADRVAHLVSLLKSTIDVDGRPMWKNTMVVCVSDISNWWHRIESIPVMISGGDDWIRMGYYLDFRQRFPVGTYLGGSPFRYVASRGDFPGVGQPYTRFLAGLMQVGGLTRSYYDQFGQGGYFGEFTAAPFVTDHYEGFRTTRSTPLPYLFL